jgi:hypothetical protein
MKGRGYGFEKLEVLFGDVELFCVFFNRQNNLFDGAGIDLLRQLKRRCHLALLEDSVFIDSACASVLTLRAAKS